MARSVFIKNGRIDKSDQAEQKSNAWSCIPSSEEKDSISAPSKNTDEQEIQQPLRLQEPKTGNEKAEKII